jgi:3-oxoacyl-[acyl-carrier protein] reductase
MVTSNPNARRDHIPVGRYGSPEEIAEVDVMLARNGYMNGQTINVNGGWFMSLLSADSDLRDPRI